MVEKKRAIEILEGLRARTNTIGNTPWTAAFVAWKRDAEIALRNIFFNSEEHCNSFTLSFTTASAEDMLRFFNDDIARADGLLQSMVNEIQQYWPDDERGSQTNTQPAEIPATVDPRKVFVVHGRNLKLRDDMFSFLAAIGLDPIEWSSARAATGKTNPYVGEILTKAFSMAQAILVLMTPDDEACLKKEFQTDHDEYYEKTLTPQPRQNVTFEAGMAMGRNEDRTVIVEFGKLRPFSDTGGRHVVRLDNSSESRQELAHRLKTAGCLINLEGTRWHKVGSFEILKPVNPKAQGLLAAMDVLRGQGQTSPVHASPVQALTKEEREILLSIRDDGWLHVAGTTAYGDIVTGDAKFFDEKDASVQAKYIDAKNGLLAKGLIRYESHNHFKLTGRGHEIRTSIKGTNLDPDLD